MSNPESYYSSSNDGRAEFWQNLLQPETIAALTAAGLSGDDRGAIAGDAQLGYYIYHSARQPFDEYFKSVIAFLNVLASGPEATPTPVPPEVPVMPGIPDVTPVCGLELRRVKWVPRLKAAAGYTTAIGITCKVEAGGTPFDPTTYQAEISGLTSPSARVLAGKFRKAYGAIDAMNMYGRKAGTVDFALLKTCLTSPFTLTVPLAGAAPEAWEFQGRAVIKDAEIGIPSPISPVLVHG